ncbi:putative hydrolase of the HAD superfamily [Lentzea atacamensis]|uniref:Hydrolase of the HAD superfamily n=1 Tax=Lentzea atacamensis TaxID=531938 RepID=A0ABX9EHC6_9PSEU|nr:HAD family phosphatase [Lentzea atacamensis]RAS69949.1 putative hydrolase of the HAD superfamily [Lentzea atacamensis]
MGDTTLPEPLVDALVFDWGGVMTVSVPEFVGAWLHAEAIDRDVYNRVMREWMSRDALPGNPVHRLETGELTVAQFERLLAAELITSSGAKVEETGLLRRMFGGATPDPAMVELVRKARAAGLHTALLSNSWGEGYPKDLLIELFDTIVISGRVGLRKPDERIYHHTLGQIGVPAGRAVFFDDAPVNVEAAKSAGMHAFRHTTADDTRANLATLGVTL